MYEYHLSYLSTRSVTTFRISDTRSSCQRAVNMQAYGRTHVFRTAAPRDAQSLGLTVVRTWAFNDGNQWNAMQPSMGVLDERVLREVSPGKPYTLNPNP